MVGCSAYTQRTRLQGRRPSLGEKMMGISELNDTELDDISGGCPPCVAVGAAAAAAALQIAIQDAMAKAAQQAANEAMNNV